MAGQSDEIAGFEPIFTAVSRVNNYEYIRTYTVIVVVLLFFGGLLFCLFWGVLLLRQQREIYTSKMYRSKKLYIVDETSNKQHVEREKETSQLFVLFQESITATD